MPHLAQPFWRMRKREDGKDREKGSELTLLVVRAFEVVQVLEGDLLEDGVETLTDVLDEV